MVVAATPTEVLQAFIRQCQVEEEKEHKRILGQSWLDVSVVSAGAARRDGRNRFDKCVEILTGGFQNTKWSINQRRMFRLSLDQLLPLFYRSCWDQEADSICKEHGVQKYIPYLYAKWPRRDGKTQCLGGLTIAVALACPGITIVCFSIGKRVSSLYKDVCLKHMQNIPQGEAMVDRNSSELMTIYPSGRKGEGPKSSIVFLPGGSGSKLRGISADWVQLEEAEFIDPALVFDVVMPLAGLKRLCISAISSPQGDATNYMEDLAQRKLPDGSPLWIYFAVEHQCPTCAKDKTILLCRHTLVDLPFWKGETPRRQQEEMYKDDPIRYKREVLGITINDEIPDFTQQDLDTLLRKERFVFPAGYQPPRIFHNIDPGAGSGGSDTAIASATIDLHQKIVWMGCDSFPMEDANSIAELQAMDAYLMPMRQRFRSAIFVFSVESNNNWVRAKDICRYLEKYRPCKFFFEDPKHQNRPGIWVGPEDKTRYVRFANRFLQYGHIQLHEPFYTSQNVSGYTAMILSKWLNQMKRFRWVPKKLTDPRFQSYAGTHTGKDKSSSSQDDMALAFIQGLYAMAVFLMTPEYMHPYPTIALGGTETFRHLKKRHRDGDTEREERYTQKKQKGRHAQVDMDADEDTDASDA